MGETMKWTIVGIAILASLALGVLYAWLFLKIVLTSLMRGSASRRNVGSPLKTKHPGTDSEV